MSHILTVDRVRAGYGKSVVLEDVTISVGEEEVVAVLGPNGSGKSTLAKTVMRLTTLSAGQLDWCGRNLARCATWQCARLGLGYVPQVENVFRDLTVHENLECVGGARSRDRDDAIAELFDLLPVLARRRRVRGGDLSGGERRMLAIAVALAQAPRMMILDEPTSDLAPSAIDAVFEIIEEVRTKYTMPMLLVEQNVDRALEIADRVAVLVRGRVVHEAESATITADRIGELFMGTGRVTTPQL